MEPFPLVYAMYGMLFIVLATFTVKLFLQRWIARQESQAQVMFSNENELIRNLANRLEQGNPYRNYIEMLLQAFSEHKRVSTQVDLSEWLSATSVSAKRIQQGQLMTSHACFYVFAFTAAALGVILGAYEIYSVFLDATKTTSFSLPQVASAFFLIIFGFGISVFSVICGCYLYTKNIRNIVNFERFVLASFKMFLQTAETVGYQSPKQYLQMGQAIKALSITQE